MVAINGDSISAEVQKFLGDPYVYGGAGPTQFDCSGLVQYALEKLGLSSVPRTSEAQWAWVNKIQYSQLQPGDLVFSQWPGDDASPGHVAVYVGSGDIVEAPSPGQSVHKIPLDSGYRSHVVGYGRVPGASAGTGSASSDTTSSGSSGGGGGLLGGVAGAIVGVFGPVAEAFTAFTNGFNTMMHGVLWIVNPMNWVRIVAGVIGAISLVAGLVFVVKAA